MTNEPARAEEQVLLVVHKHWASFLRDAAVVILPSIAALLILVVFWRLPSTVVGFTIHVLVTFLFPFSVLVVWIMVMTLWTNYYLDMLIVTDRRIFYTSQVNLSNETITEWSIPDVKRINIIMKSFLESYFHFGTISMEMREDGETAMIDGIPNPEYVSAVILKQDDRYGELKETARKQQELLKFISHEVKGHLAKSKAAFAAIVEGDYGPVPSPLHSMAGAALADSEKGVDTVMSLLKNSDLKSGAVTLDIKQFDLSNAVRASIEDCRMAAAQKGLSVRSTIEEPCTVAGDEKKITQHVIRNLIDNAIRYTPDGNIEITLKKINDVARLVVSDTGVGITESDMRKLFTEGGTGLHSSDINKESTGYGLFVAKQIVDAHDGRIWAQSGGPGTGSHFFVELPLSR